MAAKREEKYYEAFCEMAQHSCRAAVYLKEIFENYDPAKLDMPIQEMHSIEHEGDVARHKVIRMIAKDFVTPIDREDIMELSSSIDDVTDKIEDVLLRLYMFNIQAIRKDAFFLVDVMVKITKMMADAISEFAHYKKSKTIRDLLVEINNLEEEGDRLYTAGVRAVFTDAEIPPLEAAAWNQVFHYMEDVFDACEDCADVIEGVIMKNS